MSRMAIRGVRGRGRGRPKYDFNGDEGECFENPNFGSDLDEVVAGANKPVFPTTYRRTTLGKLLSESLDELKGKHKIDESLYEKCMRQFDRAMKASLSELMTSKISFKATSITKYKFFEREWAFYLQEVEFRERHSFINIPKLQIQAYLPRNIGGVRGLGKKRWRKTEPGAGQPKAK